MSARRWLLGFLFAISASCLMLGQSQEASSLERDPQSLDILSRVVQAGGGFQALAAVGDITEKGEISVYWGAGFKGSVTIKLSGGSRFRMDADLPQGKSTWIVKDAVGSKTESKKTTSISSENAINLGELTYPIAYAVAALKDAKSNVSFIGIEKRENRSVYRVLVKGRLGLTDQATPLSNVSKNLLIDALTFDIVSVEDYPYRTYTTGGRPSKKAPRAIEFGNFRSVNGLRTPFAISTKLQGQKTLDIRLTEVELNTHLSVQEFELQSE